MKFVLPDTESGWPVDIADKQASCGRDLMKLRNTRMF
jgi:hypothetical protein